MSDKKSDWVILRRRIEDAQRKRNDKEKLLAVAKMYDIKTDDLDLTTPKHGAE